MVKKTIKKKQLSKNAVLRDVRDIFADRKRFAKNDAATTKNGSPISPTNKEAYCFCTGGAVAKVVGITAPSFAALEGPRALNAQPAIKAIANQIRKDFPSLVKSLAENNYVSLENFSDIEVVMAVNDHRYGYHYITTVLEHLVGPSQYKGN